MLEVGKHWFLSSYASLVWPENKLRKSQDYVKNLRERLETAINNNARIQIR